MPTLTGRRTGLTCRPTMWWWPNSRFPSKRWLGARRSQGGGRPQRVQPVADRAGRELTTEASIVVVNEPEVAELSGASITATDDLPPSDGPPRRLRRADQIVIVTLGAAGALAVGPDGIDTVPGIGVEAVDTTGAGDCFLGALAASLAGGMDLSASLRRANRAAAWSVQRHGAVTAMPVAAEIDGKGEPTALTRGPWCRPWRREASRLRCAGACRSG